MADILRRLPFTELASVIRFPLGTATVRPDQILVWVTLTQPGFPTPPSVQSRFPAVLDTGCGYPFILHMEHFQPWVTGNSIVLPPLFGPAAVFGMPANRFNADVWIYRNQPGAFDQVLPGTEPARMEVDDGVGVIVSPIHDRIGPAGPLPRPRLPLIGLPLLVQNSLRLTIDGGRRQARLQRMRQFWFDLW